MGLPTVRGWKPKEFTDSGKPKIDEPTLKALSSTKARAFARILELKHLGQVAEGKNAWLKLESKGRVHTPVCSTPTPGDRPACGRTSPKSHPPLSTVLIWPRHLPLSRLELTASDWSSAVLLTTSIL